MLIHISYGHIIEVCENTHELPIFMTIKGFWSNLATGTDKGCRLLPCLPEAEF